MINDADIAQREKLIEVRMIKPVKKMKEVRRNRSEEDQLYSFTLQYVSSRSALILCQAAKITIRTRHSLKLNWTTRLS